MQTVTAISDAFTSSPFLTTSTDSSYTLSTNTTTNTKYFVSAFRTIDAAKVEHQPSQASIAAKRPLTGREFMEQQYREGKLLNLPTQQPLTPEEEAELERLARVFAGGKPMSEMIIEDRGPY